MPWVFFTRPALADNECALQWNEECILMCAWPTKKGAGKRRSKRNLWASAHTPAHFKTPRPVWILTNTHTRAAPEGALNLDKKIHAADAAKTTDVALRWNPLLVFPPARKQQPCTSTTQAHTHTQLALLPGSINIVSVSAQNCYRFLPRRVLYTRGREKSFRSFLVGRERKNVWPKWCCARPLERPATHRSEGRGREREWKKRKGKERRDKCRHIFK